MCLNVTAVYTIEQVKEITEAVTEGVPTYISVFAGRIADTGVDPLPLMKESVDVAHSKEGVKLLWASCRELFNVIQADEIGADIITCPADVVKKVNTNLGRDINELSVDTVKGFAKDIPKLRFIYSLRFKIKITCSIRYCLELLHTINTFMSMCRFSKSISSYRNGVFLYSKAFDFLTCK